MVVPIITGAVNAPYPVTVEITFSQAMLRNAALIKPSTYQFNNGAYTTSVYVILPNVIMLTVENLYGYPSFVITAQPGLFSATGEALDRSVTISVPIASPSDNGFNAISAANGRLKSGILAKKVWADDSSWYILTESGLDVIDKASLFNKGYILQQSGFNTIFVT